ncbi:hypothetical protein AC792_04765 [Arthrobacter sp. RIT-PI-e]|uniref:DUF6318 family protein n=1 Tax=Arthrobacter sp. RIT-PI-e TaxID=1681197 RepID=UPI000675C568|nr:DUF6318 family protein [Arthrobacter sp. RIT-PI-e]KNC19694.1 hypothetical protein AC792_04765 [Arthrobacter sp. RIT-PI-e]
MNFSRTAATAALTLLALTACAGTPASAPRPPPPPVPRRRAPRPRREHPAAGEQRLVGEVSPAGARAFLYHSFELKGYGLQTGDPAALLDSVDGASAEEAEAERLAAVYDDGGGGLGGPPKVTNVLLTTADDDGTEGSDVTAVIPVNPGAYAEVAEDGSGGEQRPFVPGGTVYAATIRHEDGAWHVTELEETPDVEVPEA